MLLKWYPKLEHSPDVANMVNIGKLPSKFRKKEAKQYISLCKFFVDFLLLITCDKLNETKKVSFKLTVTKLHDKKTSPLQTVMEFFLFHSKANSS